MKFCLLCRRAQESVNVGCTESHWAVVKSRTPYRAVVSSTNRFCEYVERTDAQCLDDFLQSIFNLDQIKKQIYLSNFGVN